MKRIGRRIGVLVICSMILGQAACAKRDGSARKQEQHDNIESLTTDITENVTKSNAPEGDFVAGGSSGYQEMRDEPINPGKAMQSGFTIALPSRELYHYDMDLCLNPDTRTVSGHVTFSFYNDSEDVWDKLCLRDYSSLFIDAETAGYNPNEVTTHGALSSITNLRDSRDGELLRYEREEDASVVFVELKTPLAATEKMTLSYDFIARIPTVADRYGVSDGIFNVTGFYPMLAEYDAGGWSHRTYINDGECFYSEVSDYDVRITVPKGFSVASTGTESCREESDGTVTYTFAAPAVRDFVFSASERFVKREEAFDDIRVNLWYNQKMDEASYWTIPSVGMEDTVKAVMRAAKDALSAYGETFGRYPYEELDIVVSPIETSGMDYPNLIMISERECMPCMELVEIKHGEEPDDALSYDRLETCIAHEIGHQWFMGIVGNNSGTEPWLDESLTAYAELVFAEYRMKDAEPDAFCGPLERNSRKTMDMCNAANLWFMNEQGQLPLNQSYYEFKTDEDYSSAVYVIGQRALYQMEEILGRKAFHGVLREYVRRNAFANADAAKFFEVLYEYAGTTNADLNALIDNTFDLRDVETAR